MKENILKRLKKYNMGGESGKFASFGLKAIRPFLSGAASRIAGPLGLMFGSQKLGAAPNPQFTNVNVPLPGGGTTDFMTTIPSNTSVDMGAANDQIQAAMAPKFQMGGVEPLPGGMMAPIPGTDAVEFMGNKHNESGMGSDSGIMVDQQTEVEDGETMDQVTMKHGGNRDYFFSDHLKKGGVSYANMHKNILEMGGSQEDINMLARMQEKAAGRDPNQVAKLGGVVEYGAGGVGPTSLQNLYASVNIPTENTNTETGDNTTVDNTDPYGNYLKRQKEKEQDQLQEMRDALAKQDIPLEAKIGMGVQMLPLIGAMFTKQKDPELMTYTPGFTSPVVAGRVKGLTYEAPDQNAARAALSRLYTGQNIGLNRAGLGPGDQSNRQLNFSKSLNALSAIGAQESKDKLSAENLSKQSKQKAEMMNVQNELKAASINAQMIQREADRKQTIENTNAQIKNLRENEKIANRINLLQTFASNVSTGAGDIMQFKAADRLARAQGIYGIFERDKMKNILMQDPDFRKLGAADQNKRISEMYNKLFPTTG